MGFAFLMVSAIQQHAWRVVYNFAVRKFQTISMRGKILSMCVLPIALAATLQAQAPPSPSEPKIQVNFLNSCHPPSADLDEMNRALARVKEKPKFSADFEIARGVTTLTEAEAHATGVRADSGPSAWVRIRHEFPEKALLSDAQYSLSVEGGSASEALALHLRDSKEALQILISDSVTGSATEAVQADTPPDRVRVERFGKSSIVLARCPGIDQSAYEPVFQTAGEILVTYRSAMAVKTVAPAELAHLPGGKEARAKASGGKESGSKEPKAAGANH
jgi:hypothetical protein